MRVTVLTGGVGGAKLVLGLAQIIPPPSITAIVNTGDDFEHLGLPISPDIDTLLYTLSGKANAAQGWGRENESWAFMAALKSLGGPDWFNLGDGDLALHVMRLAGGGLSETTARFARAWGIGVRMLPMSDDRVSTMIDTDIGRLAFQTYFVERRCAPVVHHISFLGAAAARPAAGVIAALADADVILIAPSNPWLSVDPILAIPGIVEALRATKAPVVAVSPLVGGTAVKGPTAKLMLELAIPVTNASIAAHYDGLIDGLLIDGDDDAPDLPHARTGTLMTTLADRARVAQSALDFAATLRQ
ncbi:2-phospho-L-lactate transferase [Sphingomonas sp. 28-63-12]|uniref:2-phospho-L-lactate transferase n=1 Tax=Sphingomonas sp. 28-63-12 TaxID=1970434 RepID=UPI000BD8DC87|nr:MAG: 2-phospho-L-lactate transferase [Sphingomonas sp. 28-63-12]